MAEYIERDAALSASKIVYIEYIAIDGEGYEDGNADEIPVVFKRDIEAIPAADVVARDCYDRLLAENDELRKELPVAKCGECKHCEEHYDTDGNVPYWVCKEWDAETDYDGYCHYGDKNGR